MVYSRNFSAEYSLRPLPQMEMSMYIGTSSTSQNRKKSTKSSAVNTPSTPVSKSSIQAKYSLGRSSMFQEISTESRVRNVVSSTSSMLMPSTPTLYCRRKPPRLGVSQPVLSMNW